MDGGPHTIRARTPAAGVLALALLLGLSGLAAALAEEERSPRSDETVKHAARTGGQTAGAAADAGARTAKTAAKTMVFASIEANGNALWI